jgi:hypothetical protein
VIGERGRFLERDDIGMPGQNLFEQRRPRPRETDQEDVRRGLSRDRGRARRPGPRRRRCRPPPRPEPHRLNGFAFTAGSEFGVEAACVRLAFRSRRERRGGLVEAVEDFTEQQQSFGPLGVVEPRGRDKRRGIVVRRREVAEPERELCRRPADIEARAFGAGDRRQHGGGIRALARIDIQADAAKRGGGGRGIERERLLEKHRCGRGLGETAVDGGLGAQQLRRPRRACDRRVPARERRFGHPSCELALREARIGFVAIGHEHDGTAKAGDRGGKLARLPRLRRSEQERGIGLVARVAHQPPVVGSGASGAKLAAWQSLSRCPAKVSR